ncbi:hypothetical protein N7468_009455 [Penicillium chermesinum]|uniref:Uncharacterized protein n=1 Tax=Penicillium chermesinum TaxID=63820 RepID=A0A9W9TF04_9EURO|nr:uncharacterized protein N7468_009455 [Penicillium chermesinum]KAJ5220251.1 hypothetical protein N7468_009455 [Penicillium chermesinum]
MVDRMGRLPDSADVVARLRDAFRCHPLILLLVSLDELPAFQFELLLQGPPSGLFVEDEDGTRRMGIGMIVPTNPPQLLIIARGPLFGIESTASEAKMHNSKHSTGRQLVVAN